MTRTVRLTGGGMRQHEWTGTRESAVDVVVRTCSRCGMRETWPGARAACTASESTRIPHVVERPRGAESALDELLARHGVGEVAS